MLTAYFKRKSTQTAYYSSPAGVYLDEFTDWLAERGFLHETIRYRIHGVVELSNWVQGKHIRLADLNLDALEEYSQYLSDHGQLVHPIGAKTVYYHAANIFYDFLLATKRLSVIPAETVLPVIIQDFNQWMADHRGVMQSTLYGYDHYIKELLVIHGDNPRKYTTAKLRQFILTESSRCTVEVNKNRVTAVRMFLRFLMATDRCDQNLENAIPTVAHWRLSTLPKYLSSADVERILECCERSTELGGRNYAMLLLLARLGLRSSEVAKLKLKDVDWSNGTITLMGKNRRETKLPLPQDVGDALLHYISSFRPNVDSGSIFIRVVAPREGITRTSVYRMTSTAIRKAGVVAPSYGPHVFRHSVATNLLRQGGSLQTVGVLLRHESVETTAIYAKVDTTLLQQVTRPWPGALPC